MSEQLQIPMKKYELGQSFVEAIEVTAQFVYSLPNAGAALQRFGEQVEILHEGPHKKKSYAVYGDVIVCFKDVNGKDAYVVVSNAAFKGLFVEYAGDDANHGEVQYEDLGEKTAEEARQEDKPLTKAEQKALEKRQRLQELQKIDTDGVEKPLENELHSNPSDEKPSE